MARQGEYVDRRARRGVEVAHLVEDVRRQAREDGPGSRWPIQQAAPRAEPLLAVVEQAEVAEHRALAAPRAGRRRRRQHRLCGNRMSGAPRRLRDAISVAASRNEVHWAPHLVDFHTGTCASQREEPGPPRRVRRGPRARDAAPGRGAALARLARVS